MNQRGQAAMEFLMTYGWAILAAVIAIGVLAYFGVFSPSRMLPDVCQISPPLGCEEYKVTATTGAAGEGQVRLIVRNGVGNSITISEIAVTGCTTESALALDVTDGGTLDRSIDCDGPLALGSKFNGEITVKYLKTGNTIEQTSTGKITAEVQAA